MKLDIAKTVIVGAAATVALAGTPLRGAAPMFEVTSVKPHKAGDSHRAMPQFLPGRFMSAGVPLKIVIAFAYNVGFQSVRLSGGPDWILSPQAVYDIEATTGKDAI